MLLTEAVPQRQAWHAPGFDLRRITMISLIYAAQGAGIATAPSRPRMAKPNIHLGQELLLDQ